MAEQDIIREYYNATSAYKLRRAEELAALDHIRDPDVRLAKAELAVPREMHERLLAATIAFEEREAGLAERWIVAHEALTLFRQAGQA